MDSLTPIERFKLTIQGKPVDRVPFTLQGEVVGYTKPFLKLFKEMTGQESPADYFGFDVRGIYVNPTKLIPDFSAYPGKVENIEIDEWGVGFRPGSISHLVQMIHPLQNSKDSKNIDEYPFPDRDALYRYEGLQEQINNWHKKDLPVACFAGSIFEQAWYMRGMENLLTDFIVNPSLAHALLDRITDILITVSKKVTELGIDVLILGDDIGSQHGLLMSLEHYRKFLKFRLKKVIEAAKSINSHIQVFYHSDGNIEEAIPDLIEIGVDILNPIQPECMDPAHIKLKYGKELSFWGAISLQKTLPFGTRDEIFQEVKLRVETIGRGGRYVLAPAHVIGSDVSWQNVVALCEAVHEVGRYS